MNKTAIIGLGLVGNSIGLGLKRAYPGGQVMRVVGFDPDRHREEAALRRFSSVDEIAPNLESAVRGAQFVIISTPISAVQEVLAAIGPMLDEGATVTDTHSAKEQVMAWAGELLPTHVSFVGGHPFSRAVDLDTATDDMLPQADLFRNAPYAIMPRPNSSDQAFGRVVALAEALGAKPLFIDEREHDSFLAAVTQLPVLASAALLRITTAGPTWTDMSSFAQDRFESATEPLSGDMQSLTDSLMSNQRLLVQWLDQYTSALLEIRDLLASNNYKALAATLTSLQTAHEKWLENESGGGDEDKLRAELRQALDDARPGRNLMGSYLSDRLFRKKEKR
jgi:prephenate dehydrogenase